MAALQAHPVSQRVVLSPGRVRAVPLALSAVPVRPGRDHRRSCLSRTPGTPPLESKEPMRPRPEPHPPCPPSWNPFKNIDRRLSAIEETVNRIGDQMATQADIDALTTALTAEDAELNAGVSSLQVSVAAIAALLQAPELDVTALQAEVANSQSLADAVQAAVASAAALVPPATS